MANRVVVTGVGVVSPIGIGLKDFGISLRKGLSGIQFQKRLQSLNLGCQVGGIPDISEEREKEFTQKYNLVKLRSPGILYGCMAAVEAWIDAGLTISNRRDSEADWNTGCIFGTSCSGVDAFAYNVELASRGDVKKIGGRVAQQAMNSGVSAYIGGILGLGNQVTTNSSEGNTGTESIWEVFFRIKNGLASRMIAGSSESSSNYVFQAYDSELTDDKSAYLTFQEYGSYAYMPSKAYTPLSMQNKGFVLGSGAGALILESLRSAKKRGAKIYGEILGGSVASGGLRKDGGEKKTNTKALEKCIISAIDNAKISANQVTYINGNFQNFDDDIEIKVIAEALHRQGDQFPYINSTKSLIGHCMSGSGSIESIATLLQMENNFLHPSLNANPLHPDIEKIVASDKISNKSVQSMNIPMALKISIGIGDIFSCLVFKKWQ